MPIVRKWFDIDEKIRFVITGTANMAVRYVLFVILGVLFGITHYQTVLAGAWLLSSVTAFLSYKYLVFCTQGNQLKEFGKSVLIWIISYVINAAFLAVFIGVWQWNSYAAQALAISIIVLINYMLFKYFAFHQRKKTWLEKLYNLWE